MIKAITLRNYRTFGENGVKLPLTHEFLSVIGVNNSGKTTLLRALYELAPNFGSLGSWKSNGSDLQGFIGHRNSAGSPRTMQGEQIAPANNRSTQPRVELEFEPEVERESSIYKLVLSLRPDVRFSEFVLSGSDKISADSITSVSAIQRDFGTLLTVSGDGFVREVDWDAAAEDLLSLATTMYIGPFRNAINIGGAGYYDINIGQEFIKQFDEFKTGPDPVANESITAMLEELREIFALTTLDVSASPNKDHLVFQIDGKSSRGSELGAGINQFVVVATNVLVKKPTWLLIDEPELNLHASLQLRFLTLLARYVTRGVIYSTHSLGLARAGADQVLVATRSQGTTKLEPYQAVASLASTLGELGYGGLNDSAYKAVLLVEGVTEVRTFQQLLSKYGVRNEVVIVPLGGDNLTSGGRDQELAELKRLSDQAFAIVDSERTSASSDPEKKRAAFRESCVKQGIKCHLLERRAIENYLDQDIARRVQNQANAPDFGEYDKPGSDWSWAKEKNWRIAMEMDRSVLDKTDLGKQLKAISEAVKDS